MDTDQGERDFDSTRAECETVSVDNEIVTGEAVERGCRIELSDVEVEDEASLILIAEQEIAFLADSEFKVEEGGQLRAFTGVSGGGDCTLTPGLWTGEGDTVAGGDVCLFVSDDCTLIENEDECVTGQSLNIGIQGLDPDSGKDCNLKISTKDTIPILGNLFTFTEGNSAVIATFQDDNFVSGAVIDTTGNDVCYGLWSASP
jgi:hypothetical protein